MKSKETFMWQLISNIVMILFTMAALLPFILLVIASFTDNQYATVQGFGFFPKEWSLEAYKYIATSWQTIGRAYGMTILVTVLGTAVSLMVTSMFAYALADKELPGGKILNFLCVFTMLFSGGIVSAYYCWNQVFHVRDTILALILPGLLMSGFHVILVKNYFMFSIPESLKEAARIDGAGEIVIYTRIILPLSRPILATIGMMTALAYWNDWTNGLYYLTLREGSKYYTIQLLLNQISENINYLTKNAAQLAGANAGMLPSTTVRMAIAVVGILPIMIAYPFFQKYFVKGIMLGAVKE